MKLDARCFEEQTWPDGRKSLLYKAGDREFMAVYDPASVTREMAERQIARLVEARAIDG